MSAVLCAHGLPAALPLPLALPLALAQALAALGEQDGRTGWSCGLTQVTMFRNKTSAFRDSMEPMEDPPKALCPRRRPGKGRARGHWGLQETARSLPAPVR